MAKSGIFKIWLVGIANPDSFQYDCYGDGPMYSIGMRLKTMFDLVCQHPASSFASSDYSWEKGYVQDTDVVVYCFGDHNPNTSIIRKKGGVPKHEGLSGGTFSSASGMITEIYLKTMDGAAEFATVVANLIFHEIMHNKIDAADEKKNIHVSGGGGLAALEINKGSALNAGNIAQMAAVLSKKVPQYTAEMQAPYLGKHGGFGY